jgi:hypothetical protein
VARRTKRRPFRRPSPQQRTDDAAYRQRRVEAAAQALLSTRSPEQLKSELADREMLLFEADRAAQLDPSPENLSRYRTANADFEAVQAALTLVDRV